MACSTDVDEMRRRFDRARIDARRFLWRFAVGRNCQTALLVDHLRFYIFRMTDSCSFRRIDKVRLDDVDELDDGIYWVL